MKIALDLDGVIYEWSKTARYMLREYRGYSKEGPLGIESMDWNYIQNNVKDEDWQWLWEEGPRLGLFRYGHVVTGAQTAIRQLREDGHKLYIATHRPEEGVPDTVDWLSLLQKPEAGVVFHGVHLLTNEEPKTVVNADVLVDDKPENIVDWFGAGRKAILFSRPWNLTRALPKANDGNGNAYVYRAWGWPDVVRVVRFIDEGGAHG